MNDESSVSLLALPDGGAELRLVVHLRWQDIAALGQEAGRLAVRLQRPVTLDEAAGHRLRSRTATAPAAPAASARASAPVKDQVAGPAAPTALTVGSPVDQARQAIEQAGAAAAPPPGPQPTARHASASAGWTGLSVEASRAPDLTLRRPD
jgi:hypothetical protein